MAVRLTATIAALSIALVLGACAPAQTPAPSEPEPAEEESPAAGSSLAPGLYDLEDGRVQAIGVLAWIDLEGGFWAVTDTTAAGAGGNVAVLANGDELSRTLTPLTGKPVSIIGERFDGMSIRMAGPEIVVETVEEMSGAPGAAQ